MEYGDADTILECIYSTTEVKFKKNLNFFSFFPLLAEGIVLKKYTNQNAVFQQYIFLF